MKVNGPGDIGILGRFERYPHQTFDAGAFCAEDRLDLRGRSRGLNRVGPPAVDGQHQLIRRAADDFRDPA